MESIGTKMNDLDLCLEGGIKVMSIIASHSPLNTRKLCYRKDDRAMCAT